jgi:hypothetical protein
LAAARFAVARRELGAAAPCEAPGVAAVLPPTLLDRYLGMPCEMRDSVAERVWWLADPLFSDSLNERRVEHDYRTVFAALKRASGSDERFDWRGEHCHFSRA